MKALYSLNKYLTRYKALLLSAAFFSALMHIASLVPARIVKFAFNFIQNNLAAYHASITPEAKNAIAVQFYEGLLTYGAVIISMALLRGIFAFLSRQRIIAMGKHIEYALRNDIYAHYQTLPLSFYRNHSTGDLMTRILDDVDRVGMYLGRAITFSISGLMIFVIIIPYMLVLNTHLTTHAVLPALIITIAIYYLSIIMRKRAKAVQEQLSTLTSSAQESFTNIKILQAFAREDTYINQFAQQCATYKDLALKVTQLNALFFPSVRSTISLGTIATILIGGREVIKGNITPGEIAEFVMYMNLLNWPIFSISWINGIMQDAAASQQRINEFLNIKNSISSTKSIQRTIQGDITLDNVSLTYPASGIQALKEISLHIKAGQKVAIIGPTGSGKSTLIQLINRLYDAKSGTISIDDIPIQDYDISLLRKQMSYVPQEIVLFSGTIQDNITWGNPSASSTQISHACQLAVVQHDIENLPQKMKTTIGERGITLSGGQKQRIAIARALVRDTPILLFDDCLAAVDTLTEQKILSNMKTHLQNKTVIMASHRTSIAQLADLIIVLENGVIAEQGTHEQLIKQKGIYYLQQNNKR